MKTGIIIYRKYEERVLLNEHFNTADLFRIILSDTDFVKFQIVDETETLLLSTHYPETGDTVAYLQLVKVKREEEIVGTTYNAFHTPQFSYKKKVRWTVDGGICKNKTEAHQYADRINRKARMLIEKLVDKG